MTNGGGGTKPADNHSYLQLTANLKYEEHSSTWSRLRLSKDDSGSYFMTDKWPQALAPRALSMTISHMRHYFMAC